MAPALRLATCLELPERDPDAAPLEAALTAAGVAFAWAATRSHQAAKAAGASL